MAKSTGRLLERLAQQPLVSPPQPTPSTPPTPRSASVPGQGRDGRPVLLLSGRLTLKPGAAVQPQVAEQIAQAKAATPTAAATLTPTPEPEPTGGSRKPRPEPKQEGRPSPVERLMALYPRVCDFHAPKPLALGVYQHLTAAFPDLSRTVVRRLIKRWTHRLNYVAAVAAPGSRRFHLDGSDAGEVSDENRAFAASVSAAMTAETLPPDTLEALAVGLIRKPFVRVRRERMRIATSTRRLKISAVLDTATFADLRVPDNAMPRSGLSVSVNGRQFKADVATKSVRKVLAALDEHGPEGVVVLVQGTLGSGDTITEAGLTAQVKQRAEAA